MGRNKLSIVPTTSSPQSVKTSACPQLPSITKKSAAGIHTIKAPKTGTNANTPITVPHNNGAGNPSHQNISPPKSPCNAETTSVP